MYVCMYGDDDGPLLPCMVICTSKYVCMWRVPQCSVRYRSNINRAERRRDAVHYRDYMYRNVPFIVTVQIVPNVVQ